MEKVGVPSHYRRHGSRAGSGSDFPNAEKVEIRRVREGGLGLERVLSPPQIMKRVTYIVSDIDKALAFEWIAEGLDRRKFDLRFVLLNIGDSALEHFLKNRGVPVKRIRLRTGKGLVFTFFELWWTLVRSRPHVVHTHLRHGSLLGMPAAKLAGIRYRIHTRHHSTYNHFHHPHAVKTDKWI